MAWIAPQTGETASHLETRLNTLGSGVSIAGKPGFIIAYSGNGVRLLQKEVVTTTLYRGLTKDAADLLATQASDNTETTTYYRDIVGVSERVFAEIATGSKTEYATSRANEADGWHVTKTVTTYSADTTGWTVSTGGGSLSDTGVIVPISQDRTATFQGFPSTPISSVVTTTVIEIRNLTEAGKNAYLAQASNGARITEHKYSQYSPPPTVPSGWLITHYSYFNHGTDVMVSARYVSADDGWTVTKTTKEYGFSPNTGGPQQEGWWV